MSGNRPIAVGIGELLWDLLPKGKEMGGAPANFACHAQGLGAKGIIVSRVGDDELGREIVSRLEAKGLDISFIGKDPEFPTGTVSVELDSAGGPRFTIHEGVAWDGLVLGPRHESLARETDVVCFGTLAQRSSLTRLAIRRFLAGVPDGCLRVFDANLRQVYFSRESVVESLKRCDVLKLNDAELPVLGDMLGLEGGEGEKLARLVGDFRLKAAAMTRGARGCLLCGPGGIMAEHPGYKPENLADTVGAGDAFTAAFALGLLAGESLEKIAEKANRVASYVCSRPGGMPSLPADLRESFRKHEA